MSPADFEINPTQMTAGSGGVAPHDEEAEQSVLSAMITSPDALQEGLIELVPEDFYHTSNRVIFQSIQEMFNKNIPIDTISLADYLKSKKKLDGAGGVGGRSYLLELGNNTLALVGWRRHMEMLHRDTTLRRMIAAASSIMGIAYNAPEDTKEVVDQAERMLLDVTNRDVRSSEMPLVKIMEDLFEDLSKSAESGRLTGVATGFRRIDNCLLGLRPGQMLVIGARPGVGKTSFALNLAVNAAAAGTSVALFSLEMSKVEIGQRLLAAEAMGVSLQDIRSARIRAEQWPEVIRATEAISRLDIMVDDTPGTTVTEIRAKARRILHGKQNGLVIIDYLQLISPPEGQRRSDSRATEVSEMSRGMKIMAKDLAVPVVALSQLNRSVEGRTGKRPQLSDLRESGSIEQDADIVVLLDRSMTEDEASRKERPPLNETTFIVAKNRSGALADIPLTFLPGSTKFVEVDTTRSE